MLCQYCQFIWLSAVRRWCLDSVITGWTQWSTGQILRSGADLTSLYHDADLLLTRSVMSSRGQMFYTWELDAWQSPACSPPVASVPAKLRDYLTKFHQIFIRRRRVIGGVKACINVAILPSFVEFQCTEWRWGVPIFAESRQKSVIIVMSLERSRQENKTDHAHPYHMYLSWTFGEDRSSTFWDNWSPKGPLKWGLKQQCR